MSDTSERRPYYPNIPELPKNVKLAVVKKAELYFDATHLPNSEVINTEGHTPDQLAREVDPKVIGFETFKLIEGTAEVEGEKFEIVSKKRIKPSGTIFIDGEVMSLDQAGTQLKVPNAAVVIDNARASGVKNILVTRTGNPTLFELNDMNIHLPKPRTPGRFERFKRWIAQR